MRSPGCAAASGTLGSPAYCAPEVLGMLTPAAFHADQVRPEQSYVGPVRGLVEYPEPMTARAYAIACAALPLGGPTFTVGTSVAEAAIFARAAASRRARSAAISAAISPFILSRSACCAARAVSMWCFASLISLLS